MKSHAHQVILVNGHLVGFPWCPSMNGPSHVPRKGASYEISAGALGPWGQGKNGKPGPLSITLWLCQNSYWKWPFIVDLPIENGEFPRGQTSFYAGFEMSNSFANLFQSPSHDRSNRRYRVCCHRGKWVSKWNRVEPILIQCEKRHPSEISGCLGPAMKPDLQESQG